ncbi:MAG TPA: hypothetical protein VGH19_19265 [Verrucomicrobiae bacterium]
MSLPPPLPEPGPSPSQEKVLRKLFLTLFLRGRTSRGIQKGGAPSSVGSKLGMTLVIYALIGLVAIAFAKQSIFALSLYLHGMTTIFLGMFVAASAGEVLFNKEESDILMHRPVTTKALLWAKITVMVQVSLWLAGAFNFIGFALGIRQIGIIFLAAHAFSLFLEALFCTATVVLVYQLCLRWFGRERLDNLMTMVQMLVAIAMVLGGQLVPQLLRYMEPGAESVLKAWWIYLLPPAWFAGMDDVMVGQRASISWTLAGCGMLATALVVWLAFDKLAKDYDTGLQTLNEAKPTKTAASSTGERWLSKLVRTPPFSWWLRDPVSRASFLLTANYLFRDREVKLRIYPAIAPMLIMPVFFLLQGTLTGKSGGGFGIAFAGSYLALVPLQALGLLAFSQQWQASDIFRQAPMRGPGQLCHGARRAVLLFLTLPVLVVFTGIAIFVANSPDLLLLLLPGLIALPFFALIPNLGGKAVPMSVPIDGTKNMKQGAMTVGVMFGSMILSGLAIWSKAGGWFWWFLAAECMLMAVIYAVARFSIASARWERME